MSTARAVIPAGLVLVLLALCTFGHAAPGSIEVHVSGPAAVMLVSGTQIKAVGEVPKGGRGCLLDEIRPGEYTLVVSASGYASVTLAVTVPDGAEAEVSVTLSKLTPDDFRARGRIVGFVKDANGKPVGNAALVLLKGDDPVGIARSDRASGVYELEWYAPGAYTVVVDAPAGYRDRTYTGQEIRAGASTRLEVVLQAR